jgi:NAD(P)-dependent dehydrogenase (short-subunit alcohol dehydrogenase family)
VEEPVQPFAPVCEEVEELTGQFRGPDHDCTRLLARAQPLLDDVRFPHRGLRPLCRGEFDVLRGVEDDATLPDGRVQCGAEGPAYVLLARQARDAPERRHHFDGLLSVYGRDRAPERPLYLGSLKSNIGHTQAAAGVAGVIKMVMALRHQSLPRTLHAGTPSPEVDWSSGTVALLDEARPWPTGGPLRRAGVSSFGISGTNAHVLLEEGDPLTGPEPAEPTTVPVVLSARTPEALPAQARALHAHLLDAPDLGPADLAGPLTAVRSAFEYRAAVVTADRQTLLDSLAALGDPQAVAPAGTATGRAADGRVAMLFPGQGSQWAGMAHDLLEQDEVFAESMRACADALDPLVDWSLLDVVRDTGTGALAGVDVVQPVLFAVMVSLARAWQACGVTVDAVVGHSQGEVAAACVAGALSLADGARVAVTRSQLLRELSGTGGMVSVELPAAELDWQPAGTVLITGASGSLGPHLARSVAARGARHIALLSRRGVQAPGMVELSAELEESGTAVTVLACDVRDTEGLRAALQSLAEDGHRVTTALHAAAHLDIAPLATTTLAEFAEVVHAKVDGAINLAQLLDPAELRELVLFSSIAGVWGSGDHGAYAAANAFLDSFAEQQRAAGVPVTSVVWGIWDEQITKERTDADAVLRGGLPFIDRDTAFEGLYQTLADEEAFVAVAAVDWHTFVPVFTSGRDTRLLAEIPEAAAEPPAAQDGQSAEGGALRQRLAGLSPADRARTLVELVQAHAASVLGHSGNGTVEADAAFRQAGFDSLLSVELRNRLAAATVLDLPPTLVFDYTTPAELAGHLLELLTDGEGTSEEALLSRIDQLEADIRRSLDDETVRGRLASRIGALMTAVRPPQAPEDDGGLESADSTEDLLDLLDRQFGEA